MLKYGLLSAAMAVPLNALAGPMEVALNPNRPAADFFAHPPSQKTLPVWISPRGSKAIFNTLGSPVNYNSDAGYQVSGSESQNSRLQWIAYPFTPKADATVTEIVQAIAYVSGNNSVTVALFSDKGGVPDIILAQQIKHDLGPFPYCCSVVKFDLRTGVPVTAGKTYWVAAILPKRNQVTTYDIWNYTASERKPVIFAYYNGGGWGLYESTYGAFAVYGD